MQKITTFLMFPARAEEAVNFYVSLFDDARITSVQRFESEPAQGAAMLTFEIGGQAFMAMYACPHFRLAEGMSLFVNCETQEEVDRLYDTLAEGGERQPCGWVLDRFGVSWQIVPTALGRLMGDPDPDKARRVTEAMLQMHKIDIAALQAAYDGE